jgi:hypothetical protein
LSFWRAHRKYPRSSSLRLSTSAISSSRSTVG